MNGYYVEEFKIICLTHNYIMEISNPTIILINSNLKKNDDDTDSNFTYDYSYIS